MTGPQTVTWEPLTLINNLTDCMSLHLRSSQCYVTQCIRISPDRNMVVLYITLEVCLNLPYKVKHYRKVYI